VTDTTGCAYTLLQWGHMLRSTLDPRACRHMQVGQTFTCYVRKVPGGPDALAHVISGASLPHPLHQTWLLYGEFKQTMPLEWRMSANTAPLPNALNPCTPLPKHAVTQCQSLMSSTAAPAPNSKVHAEALSTPNWNASCVYGTYCKPLQRESALSVTQAAATASNLRLSTVACSSAH
jgi:hypothetical protein